MGFFIKILSKLTHPISLGIILVFYLLVLVFLGGVMILIIYIRTLAANEKFIVPKSSRYLIFILVFLLPKFFSNYYNYTIKSSSNSRIIINLYEYSNISISIFSIFYLLFTIVCVVKLVKFERGPLVGRL